MDDILLSDSNIDTLERMFEEVKKVLPKWKLQISPEKIQRGDYVNYQKHGVTNGVTRTVALTVP